MLARWLRYYGAEVGMESLVVLDDHSTDGSTAGLPCPVLPVPPGPYSLPWTRMRVRLVSGLAAGLLAAYDVVIYTDVDEFIVPDPDRYHGLVDYLNRGKARPVVAPLAFDIVQHPELEGRLDPDRPVLAQRRYLKHSPGMCKPLVLRARLGWRREFHAVTASYTIDRDLLLFHLKFADLAALRQAADRRHRLFEDEGRGGRLSLWRFRSEDLLAAVDDVFAGQDLDLVREMSTQEPNLAHVVRREQEAGTYGSAGGQLQALLRSPLRRVPPRFTPLL